MQKELTDLILKYKDDLRVDEHNYFEPERFREFSAKLIKMDNFQYTRKEMKEMVKFLQEKELGVYPRYAILERIVRRKSMEKIKDIDERKGLWLAIDTYMGKEKGNTDLLLVYAARYGYEKAKNNLQSLESNYNKKIKPEFQAIKQYMNKTRDKEKGRWLDEVYENHRQITCTLETFVIPYLLKELEKFKETHILKEAQL